MFCYLFTLSFTFKIFLFIYPVLVIVSTNFGFADARIASAVNNDNTINKKTSSLEETGLFYLSSF